MSFRCPMCGKFVSARGIASFGFQRRWLLASTCNPRGRESIPLEVSYCLKHFGTLMACYRKGLWRLLAYAVEQGVITADALDVYTEHVRLVGRKGMVAKIESMIAKMK